MDHKEEEKRLQELEQKENEMIEKERELAKREQVVEEMEEKIKLGFKENMYSKVNVSVKTMDIIITGLVIAFFVVIAMGYVAGK